MLLQPHNLLALLTALITAWAALCDLRTGLIPNRLVGLGCALLVLVRVGFALAWRGPEQLGTALAVCALGALATGLVPFALYAFGGIGGGDVKLLAASGIGLGPVVGLEAELYAFGFGALYAFGRAAFHGTLWQTLRGSTTLLTNPLLPRRLQKPVAQSALTPLRFGPAIFAGVSAASLLHLVNVGGT